jgi:hypothetical protein
VPSSAAAVRGALPDIVGTDGARLVLRGSGEEIGPPNGSVRLKGRWAQGRSSGEADVLVFPVSDALCEVHVTLHPSGGFTRVGPRLSRLATELAKAVAQAATPSETERHRAREMSTGRWVSVPATGTRTR